jgi:hypothetical protein
LGSASLSIGKFGFNAEINKLTFWQDSDIKAPTYETDDIAFSNLHQRGLNYQIFMEMAIDPKFKKTVFHLGNYGSSRSDLHGAQTHVQSRINAFIQKKLAFEYNDVDKKYLEYTIRQFSVNSQCWSLASKNLSVNIYARPDGVECLSVLNELIHGNFDHLKNMFKLSEKKIVLSTDGFTHVRVKKDKPKDSSIVSDESDFQEPDVAGTKYYIWGSYRPTDGKSFAKNGSNYIGLIVDETKPNSGMKIWHLSNNIWLASTPYSEDPKMKFSELNKYTGYVIRCRGPEFTVLGRLHKNDYFTAIDKSKVVPLFTSQYTDKGGVEFAKLLNSLPIKHPHVLFTAVENPNVQHVPSTPKSSHQKS